MEINSELMLFISLIVTLLLGVYAFFSLVMVIGWFSVRRENRYVAEPDNGLHVCLACGKDFVNPVEWKEDTPETWWLRLRCGECGVWHETAATHEAVEKFDRALDRRMNAIHTQLVNLDREQMKEQADSFARAMELDLIYADDFARNPS